MTEPGCTCTHQCMDLQRCPTYIGTIVEDVLTDAFDEWAGGPLDMERIEPFVERIVRKLTGRYPE